MAGFGPVYQKICPKHILDQSNKWKSNLQNALQLEDQEIRKTVMLMNCRLTHIAMLYFPHCFKKKAAPIVCLVKNTKKDGHQKNKITTNKITSLYFGYFI